MIYHIHVYKLAGKAEVNIRAGNEKEALEIGLQKAKRGELIFGEAEAEFLAESWLLEEKNRN